MGTINSDLCTNVEKSKKLDRISPEAKIHTVGEESFFDKYSINSSISTSASHSRFSQKEIKLENSPLKQSNYYNFNFQYNEPFKISLENPPFENVKKCGLKESMEKLKQSRTQCLYTFNSNERNEEIKDFINPFDSDILYNYNINKNYESSKFIEKAKEIDGKVQREIDEITRKLSEITNNDDYITNQQNKQIVSEIDHVIFNLKQSNQLDKSFSLDQIQKDELVEIVRKILFTFDSKRDINDPIEIDVIHKKQRKSIEKYDNFNDKNNKNIENAFKFEELSELVTKITNDFKIRNDYLKKFDQLYDKETISMYNSDEEKSLKSDKNSRHESFIKIKSSPLTTEMVKRYSLPNNLDSKSKFKSEKLQKLNEKMDLILSKQNNNKTNSLIIKEQKNENENKDNIENSKNINKEVEIIIDKKSINVPEELKREIIIDKKSINLPEELKRERGKTDNWNINNNKIKNNRYSVGKIELNEVFPVFTNNKKEEITLKDAKEEEEEDEPIIEKFNNKRDSYLVQMNRFQNKKEKEEIKELNNDDEKIEEENENDDFNAKKWDDFIPTKNKKQKRGSYFVQLKKKKKKGVHFNVSKKSLKKNSYKSENDDKQIQKQIENEDKIIENKLNQFRKSIIKEIEEATLSNDLNLIDLDKKQRKSEIRKEMIKQTIPRESVKIDKETEIINSQKIINEENPDNNTQNNIACERKSQSNGLEENKLIEKKLSKARESIQKELESLKLTSQNLEASQNNEQQQNKINDQNSTISDFSPMDNLKSSIKEKNNNNQPLINYKKSIKFSEDELKDEKLLIVPSPKKSRKESNISNNSDDEGIKNYQKWDNFDPKRKKKKQPLNKKNKNKKTNPVQELISEAKIEDSTTELI